MLDRNKLHGLYNFASIHLQSELFTTETTDAVPGEVLAGVIDDLYYPRHLPTEDAIYNFSWIDADVLGGAYEKYLSRILQASPSLPQMRLLQREQPLRNVEAFTNKKTAGIYYTPSFLVSYLTKEAIDRHFLDHGPELPRIIDLSCGSGSFLTASVGYISQLLAKKNRRRNWARELVTKRLICGIDSDPRAVLLAKLSLWLRLAEEPQPLPLPSLDEVILLGDSLEEDSWKTFPKNFDIVLGNPPFVPNAAIASRGQLEERFLSARGRFDYAYLFLEMALRKLAVGGILGMVMPNRLFRARDAGAARAMLAATATLNVVTDFGSNEVFRGVSAYIGTLIVTKGLVQSDEIPVRFVRVLEMAPRLMNLMLSKATEEELTTQYVQSFDIQRPTSSDPWLFLSPASRSARLRLEDRSVPLYEIADVFQGIKVGANDLFIMDVLSDLSAPIVQIRNGIGEIHTLESDLLHPVVFGAQIEEYQHVNARSCLLYPYQRGRVLEETTLAERFPLTFRYLSDYKEMLGARVSLVNSGRKWFELVRNRDQEKLESSKLLMRDLAMNTAFAIDELGSTYVIGGTAVIPSDLGLLKPLLAYLNSILTNWYLAPLTPTFQSSFQKFEPQHLSNIPILRDLLDDNNLREKLSALADEALYAKENDSQSSFDDTTRKIDTVLCTLVGVNPRT
jgi:methylase of polypeptide subunit release factors